MIVRKRYKLKFVVILLLLLCFCRAVAAENNGKDRYVLLLNSINFNLPWTKDIYWYLNNSLSKEGIPLKAESLTVPAIKNEAEANAILDRLQEKYTTPPAAVVFIGEPAWMVSRPLFDSVWKDIPVIITNTCDRLPASLEVLFSHEPLTTKNSVPAEVWRDGYNMTVINESMYIKETVELMKQLIPDMKKVALISDNRYISSMARDKAEEVFKKDFPELSLEQLNSAKISTEMLLDTLRRYDSNTGLIYYTWFEAVSKTDNIYLSDHIQEIINSFAKSPVFLLNEQNLASNNFAGGYYVSMEDYGKELYGILRKILKGEQAGNIPPSEGGKPEAYLCYTNLQSYGISPSLYPPKAIYTNAPESFFKHYKHEILLLFTIAVVAMIVVGAYIRILRRAKLQKENENRLLKLNERIFSSIIEPVFWINKDGIILKMLNHPDEKYFAASPEEITGGSLDIYVQDTQEQEDYKKAITEILRTNASAFETIHLTNRHKQDYYVTMRMVYYDDEKVVCFLHDISDIERERIRAERLNDELRMAMEKAEESNRLKSAFLANMSHEIRTPLNAIIGFSDIMMQTEDQDERQQYMEIIRNNNSLLLQLISDILDMSRVEAEVFGFNKSDTDINQMMDEVEKSALLKLKNDRIEVVCEKPIQEFIIQTDRNRIMQVVMNFVINAIKFTEKGFIRLGYRLTEDGKGVYFYVCDTGRGINDGDCERVFERFVKLDVFAQGTGLGLSICKMIIEKLQGEIGVESVPGKGSTFWFTIPYEKGK